MFRVRICASTLAKIFMAELGKRVIRDKLLDLTRTKTTKFKIQTATLLSIKGFYGVGFFCAIAS